MIPLLINQQKHFKNLLFSLVFCLISGILSAETQLSLQQQIKLQIQNGAVLLHDNNGKVIFSYQENKPLIPASMVKILTAKIAIDELGTEYRFKTEFYSNDKSDLLIKGYGDPFLISEEIEEITLQLKKLGINSINQIFLDHTSFDPKIKIPGTSDSLNPYDALVGALVVNFNTINITRTQKGTIRSAEKETPLTKLAIEKGKVVKKGTTERINLTQDYKESLQYVGELFTNFLERAKIRVQHQKLITQAVSDKWRLIYTHKNSHDLRFILRGLLKYSNNYIANQIFLTTGGEKKGFPTNLEKAKSVFQDNIKKNLGFNESFFNYEEASGLSRENLMTANMMIRVLNQFKPYQDLLAYKKKALVKSGTLTGVYNYAGYIKAPNGLCPYVIILNQERNTRDIILSLLRKMCDSL